MSITAKALLVAKKPVGEGEYEQVLLTFGADYADGRNKEWALATPTLDLRMSVKPDVAERFTEGQPYTLTFTETDD